MKVFTSEGMSPDQAFNNQANFELLNDLTRHFHKSNLDLNEYAKNYLEEEVEGYGYYIVLQKPKIKTTKKKTKVLNVVNKISRKWATIVNFVDADGTTITSSPSKVMTKAKAISKARELVESLGKDVKIVLTKEVVVGEPNIATVVPNTDIEIKGRYFFFGVENTNITEDEE